MHTCCQIRVAKQINLQPNSVNHKSNQNGCFLFILTGLPHVYSRLRLFGNLHLSKTVNIFVYLELGILKYKHLLTIKRLLYHYYILTRDDTEINKKIYNSQKVSQLEEDWYRMIIRDLHFIQIVQNYDEIEKIQTNSIL